MIRYAPQIVHESETQRQYVRLRMPSMVEINGKTHPVRDLSSGGVAIRDIAQPLRNGSRLSLKLVLPFERFALDIMLMAEVQHYDKKMQIAGCRFVNLDAAQISLLNHVVRAYIGGDIVDSNDILNVVAKNGFVNLRRADAPPEQDTKQKIKSSLAYAALGLIAVALAMLIITNIRDGMLTLRTPHGHVAGERFTIAAPTGGIFTSVLPEGTKRIARDEMIGTITPAGALSGYRVTSPCDCQITGHTAPSGQYVAAGHTLYTLLPRQGASHVSALIPVEQAHRIRLGIAAVMTVAGNRETINGTVTDIRTTGKTIPGAPGTSPLPAAEITITPAGRKLKTDLIGRPVMVELER